MEATHRLEIFAALWEASQDVRNESQALILESRRLCVEARRTRNARGSAAVGRPSRSAASVRRERGLLTVDRALNDPAPPLDKLIRRIAELGQREQQDEVGADAREDCCCQRRERPHPFPRRCGE